MTIAMGGFSGDNALLAFAAMQQGRMNDELSESMRAADTRSQMAQDIASIKNAWEGANRDRALDADEDKMKPEGFLSLDKQLTAFMEKYGEDPACADMMPSMEELAGTVKEHLAEWRGGMHRGNATEIVKYADADVKDMSEKIQKTLDAAGSNDQLTMIHIKQLNDNINNSSGIVSGIMESRQNTTASIINNLA